MPKTKIEWCDYTINPVKGLCPMHCKTPEGYEYCYAAGERGLYKRFKWNPEIRMGPDWQEELPKKPAKVFVGSTMELFGDWVKDWMWDSIWQYVNGYPQHTFIFLTKKPENLPKEFPPNCWVGMSATNHHDLANKWGFMGQIKATVKFVSLEPLLDWADAPSQPIYTEGIINSGIQWIIIGQVTPVKKITMPRMEWIRHIVEAANKAGIPVFLKENLYDLIMSIPHEDLFWEDMAHLRQEFPK